MAIVRRIYANPNNPGAMSGSRTLIPKITSDRLNLSKIQDDPRFHIVETRVDESCVIGINVVCDHAVRNTSSIPS